MRAVVQRVASASVEKEMQVEGRIVSAIGAGLLVLVGLHESDVDSDADYICRKVLNMRLFPNERTGKNWDQNVMQRSYGVLLVSQFTLYGILKGNKPDFHVAMSPERAKPFYASLVDKFRRSYNPDAVKGKSFLFLDDFLICLTLHKHLGLQMMPLENPKLVPFSVRWDLLEMKLLSTEVPLAFSNRIMNCGKT
ncbi:hypothetical protein C3L33_22631, partial [Rhododendron williamsianum]